MRKVVSIILIVAASIVLALTAGSRTNNYKESNDTFAYYNHYKCLSENRYLTNCNEELSNNFIEFVYPIFAKICSGIFEFNAYKFFIGLIICLSIMICVYTMSAYSLTPVVCLVLDFRFWEYSANTLRVGFAISLIVISFSMVNSGRSAIGSTLKFLSFFTHVSTFLLLAVVRKKLKIIVVVATVVLSWCLSPIILQILVEQFSENLFSGDKILYYFRMDDKEYQLPLHYLLVILSSLIFYKKTNNLKFIYVSNALFLLLVSSLIVSPLGMSHRISALMLPFIAVSLSYQVSMLSNISTKYNLPISIVLNSGVIAVFVYAATKNINLLLIHLE